METFIIIGLIGTCIILSIMVIILLLNKTSSKNSVNFENEIQNLSDKIQNEFRSLSSEALDKNNEKFLNMAKNELGHFNEQSKTDLRERQEAVENLVKPINEALKENTKIMNDLENKRNEAYGNINQQIRIMTEGHEKLRSETGKLVTALHNPQSRGQYGEITLRKVVELAGMSSHCDFDEQVNVKTKNDKTFRPDMVVNLPSNRSLIIDAKMPLANYLKAFETSDEENRHKFLEQHAKDVRTHIKNLSKKNYWEQFKQTPEFVIMFIGGDQILHAALEQDSSLHEFAMEQRIILTTPASLMGLLRAIAYGWQQEEISENLHKIQDIGEELYSRTNNFIEHIVKIGKSLNTSVDSYNNAIGSFQNKLIPSMRQLNQHGIGSNKELPEMHPIETNIQAVVHEEIKYEL